MQIDTLLPGHLFLKFDVEPYERAIANKYYSEKKVPPELWDTVYNSHKPNTRYRDFVENQVNTCSLGIIIGLGLIFGGLTQSANTGILFAVGIAIMTAGVILTSESIKKLVYILFNRQWMDSEMLESYNKACRQEAEASLHTYQSSLTMEHSFSSVN